MSEPQIINFVANTENDFRVYRDVLNILEATGYQGGPAAIDTGRDQYLTWGDLSRILVPRRIADWRINQALNAYNHVVVLSHWRENDSIPTPSKYAVTVMSRPINKKYPNVTSGIELMLLSYLHGGQMYFDINGNIGMYFPNDQSQQPYNASNVATLIA